ncbi:hypothetical protein IL992_06240 [Microbispora sp. NEAU-D428]|uniref:hypothetical protein n=1 Tax=Microbispora sitophila TaxID=2771537 RepID=UPI001866C777|nr:hypothetical protein [Microbispora sitophila]MBE3008787.1 hypothetical protein [Microbispora sitophila]
MRDLPGFDAFAADQAQPLARTALALTGDPRAARALVVTALTATAAKWRTVRWSFPAHAAREALYAAYLKRPRARGAARGDGHLTPGTDAAALAEALTGLTPRRRALVVACFHDGHTTWQAAGLCRMDARTANTETVLAVAELRNRLPASFVAGTPPEPAEGTAPDETPSESVKSSPASEASAPEGMPPETVRRRAAPDHEDGERGGGTRGAASGPSATSWASPSQASGPSATSWASPSQASDPSMTSWASPWQTGHAAGPVSHAAHPETALPETALPEAALPGARPAEITPPAAPFAPPAALTSPPASPPAFPQGGTGPDDRGEGPWEAALRRELAVLSAGMPALDPVPLAAEAARVGRRHGTRRRALVTTMSVTLAALVVVPLAFGAAGLLGRAGRSADGASPGVLDESAAAPRLPPALPAPVRFAYRGFCTADDYDVFADEFADNGCAQWRVVATTGEQWRVADVSPALSDGWQPLLAISRDGNRLVYFSAASSDFVLIDRLDTTTRRTDMVPLAEAVSPEDTHLVISPSGRWMAADFGPAAEALHPRVQNLANYRVRTLPRRMRVLAVSDDGTVTGTATWDSDAAPGRLTTTVLLRVRPDGRTLSRTPIDSALFRAGAAVSPDGRAIAVAAERAHPAEDDHGLLVTLDSASGRVLTRREAALPEDAHVIAVRGWASEHEVIVEAERIRDDDEEEEEEYSVHAVDVRTGAARPISLDEAGGVPALWVPGTLR